MNSAEADQIKICNEWYAAFHRRRLEPLMNLFTADPRVVVGAGGSHRAVPYAGVFDGEKMVRDYYRMRFEQATEKEKTTEQPLDPHRPVRPFCAFRKPPCEFGPWVVFSGDMKDEPDLSGYEGPFLHVFRFAPNELRIASLEMFLIP